MRHTLPKKLQVYDRAIWSEYIDDLKLGIKPDASPGVPYVKIAPDNRRLLETLGSTFNDLVLDRIEARLAYGDEISKLTGPEMVRLGLADPVKLFVKNEPHKLAKIQAGRVRLIASMSIVDKVIEMLCFSHQTKAEIKNWRNIAFCPGIGFTHEDNDFMYERAHNNRKKRGVDPAYTDCESFDWGVGAWEHLAHVNFRIYMSAKSHDNAWETVSRSCAHVLNKSVYHFSDGTMVCTDWIGGQKSGSFTTSSGNSCIRSLVGCLAIPLDPFYIDAMGDDTTEDYYPDGMALYNAYGYRVKEYVRSEDGTFEFCSRIYGPGYSYPANPAKTIMNMLHQKVNDFYEALPFNAGFEDIMSEHPKFAHYKDIMAQAGWSVEEGPQIDYNNLINSPKQCNASLQ